MTIKIIVPWAYEMTFRGVREIEKLPNNKIKLIFRAEGKARTHSIVFPKNRTEACYEYYILETGGIN